MYDERIRARMPDSPGAARRTADLPPVFRAKQSLSESYRWGRAVPFGGL
jgi:hypothetical protein